jgi:hypothetical protein
MQEPVLGVGMLFCRVGWESKLCVTRTRTRKMAQTVSVVDLLMLRTISHQTSRPHGGGQIHPKGTDRAEHKVIEGQLLTPRYR